MFTLRQFLKLTSISILVRLCIARSCETAGDFVTCRLLDESYAGKDRE